MTAQRLRRRLGARLGARGTDAGFSLMEVLVALLTLTFVSVATASFFIHAVSTTQDQSQKESALALATQSLEAVKAVPVGTVLAGRTQAAVHDLVYDPAIAPLLAQDVVDADNYDLAASSASVPLIPISAPQLLQATTFQVRTAINRCWLSTADKTCTRAQPVGSVSVFRATVNVRWGPDSCGIRCSYATSALLDAQADPLFNIATSQPIIVTTTPQTAPVGSTVPLTLTGVALANGATLSIPVGGGTFDSVVRVGTDGKKTTANWNVGSVPGAYTMTLVNPDTGRAEFSSLAVTPIAKLDCTTTQAAGEYIVAVRTNDVPAGQGTVTITTAPALGTTTVYPDSTIGYRPDPSDLATTFQIGYTTTVNGQISAPATLTVTTTGAC